MAAQEQRAQPQVVGMTADSGQVPEGMSSSWVAGGGRVKREIGTEGKGPPQVEAEGAGREEERAGEWKGPPTKESCMAQGC